MQRSSSLSLKLKFKAKQQLVAKKEKKTFNRKVKMISTFSYTWSTYIANLNSIKLENGVTEWKSKNRQKKTYNFYNPKWILHRWSDDEVSLWNVSWFDTSICIGLHLYTRRTMQLDVSKNILWITSGIWLTSSIRASAQFSHFDCACLKSNI